MQIWEFRSFFTRTSVKSRSVLLFIALHKPLSAVPCYCPARKQPVCNKKRRAPEQRRSRNRNKRGIKKVSGILRVIIGVRRLYGITGLLMSFKGTPHVKIIHLTARNRAAVRSGPAFPPPAFTSSAFPCIPRAHFQECRDRPSPVP